MAAEIIESGDAQTTADPVTGRGPSTRVPLDPNDFGPARYERKCLLTSVDSHQLIQLIRQHPACFREPFPPRMVNNIYLDNEEHDSYRDNLDGCASRLKVRIRWYGETLGRIDQPVLELKIKDGLIGWKRQYPLAPFSVETGLSQPQVRKALQNPDIPARLALFLQSLSPSLLNRYGRRYFLSADGRYRLTVDTSMQFYPIRRFANLLLTNVIKHDEVVLELKYGKAHSESADSVSSWFPFRWTKNSKYVDGLRTLYLW
jgi:hypothetical protein